MKHAKNLFEIVNRTFANQISGLFTQPKSALHTTAISQVKDGRAMPRVYYYQNPLHWLKIKWQLLKLRHWDEEFNEKEFTRGSTYAISSVTKIVSHQDYDNLEELLTPFALSKLRRDVLVLWNDEILRNISLALTDIKLAVPTRVQTRTAAPYLNKVCDIDMWYMAMKWRDMDALLIIDIVARFNRNFSNSHQPDWTISFFELRKYHIQNYAEQNKH